MKAFIILTVLVSAAVSQLAEPNYPPIPYSFSYAANTEDGGSSSRQESGDGAGRVTGSYTVTDLEGGNRVVEYVADEAGFRAAIRTNELGTANMNPADVTIESSAPDVSGVSTYSMGAAAPYAAAPVISAPIAPAPIAAPRGRAGVRYVMVPITDPRARGYY